MQNANHTEALDDLRMAATPLVEKYLDIVDKIKELDITKEALKDNLDDLLKKVNIDEIDLNISGDFVRVVRSLRTTKKLDKDKLGASLNIPSESLNGEFILKLVDEGKLSYKQYKSFQFLESMQSLAIRKRR